MADLNIVFNGLSPIHSNSHNFSNIGTFSVYEKYNDLFSKILNISIAGIDDDIPHTGVMITKSLSIFYRENYNINYNLQNLNINFAGINTYRIVENTTNTGPTIFWS